jgi:hypothetical protein
LGFGIAVGGTYTSMARHHNVNVGDHLPMYRIRRGEFSASSYIAFDELEQLLIFLLHLISQHDGASH